MSTSPFLEMAQDPAKRAWLDGRTPEEIAYLYHDWGLRARPEQLPPAGDWTHWLYLGGRGVGKTRTASEWVRANVDTYGRWLLVGRTAADVRDTMIEGESGLLNIGHPDQRPRYEPSNRKLVWPNGAIAILRESGEPEGLRGEQCEAYWADELAAWIHPQETWDMLMFGFRLGPKPRGIITTTPKPIGLLKTLMADPACVVTRGTTFDNRANLPTEFFNAIISRYQGTRLGRQELLAEVLDDVPGALWTRAMIDANRVDQHPELTRVVVGIDPGGASDEGADETGIVVSGVGTDGHGYVLADGSLRATPMGWAQQAVSLYRDSKADRIVAEANFGGEMVEHVIRSVGGSSVSFKAVHASRGKAVRAEPVAALYEQGRIHHVGADFAFLEDQLCSWVPGSGMDSPDRMDALVWALTELMVDESRWTAWVVRAEREMATIGAPKSTGARRY